MSKRNIKIPDFTQLSWDRENQWKSLDTVVEYARTVAIDVHDWYVTEKRRKQKAAKMIRLAAILMTALAGVIPILTEMGVTIMGSQINAGWASVSVAAAGGLVLFDRFFGFSTGWIRFTATMMKVRNLINLFDMDRVIICSSWTEDGPDKEQIRIILERCKQLVEEVNTAVIDETRKWDHEFSQAIGSMDDQVKKAQKTGPSFALPQKNEKP